MSLSSAAVASTEAVNTPAPDRLPSHELLAKARAENFPVALRFLPARERGWLSAIYGWARLVDDVGDLHEGDRLALLDWLEADLDRAFRGNAEHPLVAHLTPFVTERKVPRDPFVRLVEANRLDQRVSRYPTYSDLAHYCSLSANPVGELVLHVFAVASDDRIRWSDDVCTALQIAEHLQDVGEDHSRGRVYLPLEDLEQFDVSVGDLSADQPSQDLRRLLAFEVGRARGLLESGTPLVASLRGRARLAIAAYVGGGHAALAAVEGSGYDVLRLAPSAGNRARFLATVRVLGKARS